MYENRFPLKESMISGFLDAIAKVRQLTFTDDDDWFDRLSRRYSVIMLALFAVVVSTKQYVGDPIACWTPAQFTGAHVEYTNYICWISNKYYVDFKRRLPGREDEREHKIAYYQWVPFILIGMMVCYHVPSLIWKFLLVENGVDLASMIRTLNSMDEMYPSARTKTLKLVGQQLNKLFTSPRRKFNYFNLCVWAKSGFPWYHVVGTRSLTVMYTTIKLIYLVNGVLQLFMLEYFIGEKKRGYGIYVLARVINGGDWTLPMRFPRVTYCDFTIRTMGDNLHQHTVQCVLPINLFNEKIFLIVWFWYTATIILTTVGIAKLVWSLVPSNRYEHISKLISTVKHKHGANPIFMTSSKFDRLQSFVDNYLGYDGYLLMSLIASNTSNLVTGEVLNGIWEQHYKPGHSLVEPIVVQSSLLSPHM